MQMPTLVFQDNTCSVHWAEGSDTSELTRRKQVDVRFHHVRDKVKHKEINLVKVLTGEIQADFLTKSFEPGAFVKALERSQILAVKSEF